MGGVGTFLPLYYRFLEAARKSLHVKQRAEAVQGAMEATVATAYAAPQNCCWRMTVLAMEKGSGVAEEDANYLPCAGLWILLTLASCFSPSLCRKLIAYRVHHNMHQITVPTKLTRTCVPCLNSAFVDA